MSEKKKTINESKKSQSEEPKKELTRILSSVCSTWAQVKYLQISRNWKFNKHNFFT